MVVDDNPGLRNEIRRIFESASDIECLGLFVSAEEALPKILERNPNIVLMDINLPGMSGIQCASQIKRAAPIVEIVMITVFEDTERFFCSLKAGASGCLVKSHGSEQLIEAVRYASRGGAPMSPSVARKVAHHFRQLGPSAQKEEKLSAREGEILDLLTTGFTYTEISNKLSIGMETVRICIKNICLKLYARSRLESEAKRCSNHSNARQRPLNTAS